jgi:hypothetical protein
VKQRCRRWAVCGLILVAGGVGAAAAQERYTFTAALAGGLAGVLDDAGAGGRDFEHPALQAMFGMFTDERTLTTLRVGQIAFDAPRAVAGLTDAELQYVDVAGEYRFRQTAYDFGIFLGVGGYRVSGDAIAGETSESALGAALGFTGEFDLTRRLSLVAEIDFHYVFFDDESLHGAALAGLAVHF